jgi:hypothetical protein
LRQVCPRRLRNGVDRDTNLGGFTLWKPSPVPLKVCIVAGGIGVSCLVRVGVTDFARNATTSRRLA